MKKLWLFGVLLSIVLLSGCASPANTPVIDDAVIHSTVLDKDIPIKVYLPSGYSTELAYPVLYFIADAGGTAHTVMYEYAIAQTAEAMLAAGEIESVIIVGFGTDTSFGINSAETVSSFETVSGKQFRSGRYSDFIVEELIVYIDSHYATNAAREGRFIGGYSMGGFAALHNAFSHPSLFSKAGGHSPSLFTGDFPDKTVSDWLYPSPEIRQKRDPLYIAQHADLSGLSVFLDVEEGGSGGVQRLYEILREGGIDAEFQVLSLSHSRASCASNMREYLRFYAGAPD